MTKLLRILVACLLFPIKMLGTLLLTLFLPAHTRRLFFIATLYARVVGIVTPKASDFSPLVYKFGVVNEEGAAIIPALCQRWVWDKTRLDVELDRLQNHNRDVLKDVCISVVNVTPKWMLYGRREDMIADLMRLFDEVSVQPKLAMG